MTSLKEKEQSVVLTKGRWIMGLVIALALTGGAVSLYNFLKFQDYTQTPTSEVSESLPAIVAVTALGRLEPQGEVIRLSAPASTTGGARVEKLLVKEGDNVRAGQEIALLDGHTRSVAALEQAKSEVQVAQARLAQVEAGAKQGDLSAQKATIARLEAELDNARLEHERHQALFEAGAISASLLDSKRLVMETTQKELQQAQATLTSLAEVRPADVQVARAEVKSAIAAVKQAEADVELTYVRSPIDGQVLKVHVNPGELVSNTGIAEIGKTDQMYVVAEVYETDIEKVRLGQSASITSTAFTGEIEGTVTQIGLQVDAQDVFAVSPGADTDRKVIEVKIQIDNPADSQRVAGLTNLQVEVAIQIQQSTMSTRTK